VVEVSCSDLGTDELTLHLLSENPMAVESKILALFQSNLRVLPAVKFITRQEMDELQASSQSRKIKKFIDSRK